MDDPAHDERMRRLQRLAYGAVASDAERAAALAELESLRREAAASEAEHERADASRLRPRSGPDAPAPTGAPAAAAESAASRGNAAKPLKWVIAVGTVALLVGVAVGWQAGARMSTSEPSAEADRSLGASTSIQLGVGAVLSAPVVSSLAYEVFDRAAAPTDTPAFAFPGDWFEPSTLRLLASTPDGVSIYGAKAAAPDAKKDVCIVIVRPDTPPGGSCTTGGMFDEGSLRSSHFVEGVGSLSATWHADGTVQVTVPRR